MFYFWPFWVLWPLQQAAGQVAHWTRQAAVSAHWKEWATLIRFDIHPLFRALMHTGNPQGETPQWRIPGPPKDLRITKCWLMSDMQPKLALNQTKPWASHHLTWLLGSTALQLPRSTGRLVGGCLLQTLGTDILGLETWDIPGNRMPNTPPPARLQAL